MGGGEAGGSAGSPYGRTGHPPRTVHCRHGASPLALVQAGPGRYRRAIEVSALTGLLSALGLSGASGLNAWLPLTIVALLGRAGWIDLDPAFADLTRTPVLLALVALFLLDFVADKIPAVDHAMHAAGLVVHPVVGAALFDLQAGGATPLLVNLLAGGTVAGGLHAARAAARPAVNGLSAGTGAPVVSLLEDVASVLLTIVAFLLPALAALIVVVLLISAVLIARKARRILRRRTEQRATPQLPAYERRHGSGPHRR